MVCWNNMGSTQKHWHENAICKISAILFRHQCVKLTHWGLNKKADILQTTFLSAFSEMKILVSKSKFQRKLFLWPQMKSAVGLGNGLMLNRWQAITWTNDDPYLGHTWWHHQMETFSTLALCKRYPPVTVGFRLQRPMMGSFDVFFDLCLNKRLSK